jgi:type I restriction-modification system DNA methylase subunit
MSERQSDLNSFSADANDFSPDLTETIRQAAEDADSEEDFAQQIRSGLDSVMQEFSLDFDYVDSQIGSLDITEFNSVFDNLGVSLDNLTFDQDDIREGGQRPDAVAGASVTDYKDPGTLDTESGQKSALGQLVGYMIAVSDVQNVDVSDTVGIVTDGHHIIFLHGDELAQPEIRPVNESSVREYINLLVGHYAVLTVDRVLSDFGESTEISVEAVESFYNCFNTAGERSEKFFNEWTLLFEQVCGFDFDSGSELLEENYGITIDNDLEFKQALFSLYTYYALIAKLLAAEFIHYHQDSRFLSFSKRLIGRSDEELRLQMEKFEEGWVFKDAGVDNFLEISLFSWYTEEDAWNENTVQTITRIAEQMRKYDPGRIREDPQEARDLFKNLYQRLVPDELRNQLGEVFTPDWLAELTIERSGYDGDGSVLDPTCGSGTFLVFAARKKKEKYKQAHGESLTSEQKGELAEKILTEIEGFDLNPIAVLAARTNLLIEMGDLLGHYTDDVPVYLADSVRPPEVSGQLSGSFYTVKEIPEASDDVDRTESEDRMDIKIPEEIIDRNLVNEYFNLAKKYTLREVSVDGFIDEFTSQYGINEQTTETAIRSSYDDIADLHDRDVNGVWWGIVKNRFRPQFCGKFDYLIGNPPYNPLDDLANDYRDKIKSEWEEYGILPDGASAQKKIEHGLLFTCVGIDKYLKPGGNLSFILPLTTQRGGAGAKFREYISGHTEVFDITDLADLNPFDITRNRPLILSLQKGGETEFPVPCETWIGSQPDFDSSLSDVVLSTYEFEASYMGDRPSGKWYSAPPNALQAIKKTFGESPYSVHEGIGLEGGHGIFFVNVIDESSGIVENTNEGNIQWDQERKSEYRSPLPSNKRQQHPPL